MRTLRTSIACLVVALTASSFGTGCADNSARGALTNGQGVAGVDPNAEDNGGEGEETAEEPVKTAEPVTPAPAPAAPATPAAPVEPAKPVEEPVPEGSFAVGTVLTTKADLNLRSGPGTGFDIVTLMPNGSTVTVLKISGADGWVNVKYNDQEGFASTMYLQK